MALAMTVGETITATEPGPTDSGSDGNSTGNRSFGRSGCGKERWTVSNMKHTIKGQ